MWSKLLKLFIKWVLPLIIKLLNKLVEDQKGLELLEKRGYVPMSVAELRAAQAIDEYVNNLEAEENHERGKR